MKESRLWEINARLVRVLPLVRDEAALSRLVQHVHPDAPADQVRLLVDDLKTLLERDLSDLATGLPYTGTQRVLSGTIHPRTGRFTFDGPPLSFTEPDTPSKDLPT